MQIQELVNRVADSDATNLERKGLASLTKSERRLMRLVDKWLTPEGAEAFKEKAQVLREHGRTRAFHILVTQASSIVSNSLRKLSLSETNIEVARSYATIMRDINCDDLAGRIEQLLGITHTIPTKDDQKKLTHLLEKNPEHAEWIESVVVQQIDCVKNGNMIRVVSGLEDLVVVLNANPEHAEWIKSVVARQIELVKNGDMMRVASGLKDLERLLKSSRLSGYEEVLNEIGLKDLAEVLEVNLEHVEWVKSAVTRQIESPENGDMIRVVSGLEDLIAKDRTFEARDQKCITLKEEMEYIHEILGNGMSAFLEGLSNLIKAETLANPLINDVDLFFKIYSYIKREWLWLRKPDVLKASRLELHRALRDETINPETANYFNDHFIADTVPYGLTTQASQAKEAFDQSMQILRLTYDQAYGAGSLQYIAKSNPRNKSLPLRQCAEDLGAKYTTLISGPKYPGYGGVISGINPANFMDSQPGTEDFQEYKKAWPWARNAIDNLIHTHFAITRGFIAIWPPNQPEYRLGEVHYSLIIFNEHFGNERKELGFLVPVEHLQAELSGRTEFDSRRGSLENSPGLTPERLASGLGIKGGPVLNLGWVSNIAGLCNARMPFSVEYHAWERNLSEDETFDHNGHFHKTHMNGGYTPKDITSDLKFIAHQNDHLDIYKVARELFALRHILSYGVDSWSKGYVIGQTTTELPVFNLARDWFLAKRSGFVHSNDCPVLVVCPTLELSARPIPNSPRLDSATVTFTAASGEEITPENLEYNEATFMKLFAPYLTNTNTAIRLLHRKNLL